MVERERDSKPGSHWNGLDPAWLLAVSASGEPVKRFLGLALDSFRIQQRAPQVIDLWAFRLQ
jgi:hypothetical protein